MKRFILFLLAAAVLAGIGYYWRFSASTPVLKPAAQDAGNSSYGGLPVRAGVVRTGAISEELSAVGSLIASESVMIRPERDGRIAEILFREGELVRKDAKLVTLDAAEIEAQLAAASAELSLNRSRMKRAEELHAKNFISAQALDEARENLNQSLAREAEIKARLSKTVISAPFEGVAGLRQVSPGAYVKAGQDIARLEGIGTLKLDFRVPELHLAKLRPGQAIQVRLDAFAEESFRGEIYAIEPTVEEQSRTVLLRARVPNPGARLKPGMFARVNLVLGTRPQALLVPEQAVVPRGQDTLIYRIVEGKAVPTRVELGVRRTGEVEVVKGLAAGDTIVIDGQMKIKDGSAVTVLPDQPATLKPRAKAN